MEEKIDYGNREIFISVMKDANKEIAQKFIDFLNLKKEYFIDLFNEYKIPKQITMYIDKGDGKTHAVYLFNSKETRKQITQIGINTIQYKDIWEWSKEDNKGFTVLLDLIDSFVHEIIHNRVSLSENEVKQRTTKFVVKAFPDIIDTVLPIK